MIPTQIRRALASLGMLAAFSPAVVVHAATISYNNGSTSMSITDNSCGTSIVLSGGALICQSSGSGTTLTAPTGCSPSILTNPTTLTSTGGTATVSVSGCTASNTLTYTWTKNGAAFSTLQNPPADTLPANTSTTTTKSYSYQVTVCNTDGTNTACTSALPATLLTAVVPFETGSGTGSGTGTGAADVIAACKAQGFNNIIVMDFKYVPGTQPTQVTSSPFGNGDVVVARFTTPSLPNYGNGGFMNVVDHNGWAFKRFAALNRAPCEFSYAADETHALYKNAQFAVSPYVIFSADISGGVALKSNTTYYYNVKNADLSGTGTCGAADCPIKMTLDAR